MQFERTADVDLPFDAAVQRTREALAAQGFGILTEIDMQATLLAKRQVDVGPYVILGACNPALAEGALTTDPRIGVLLPCSVVVRATGPSRCQVHIFDPDLIPAVTDVAGLSTYADDAGARIGAALTALAS
ncbi:DUF302 domain-containing protein [Actinotalea sp. M2MS4P-6]|uniref:DUF302 domain-containing protein n=1 Tax=Actinotalea sp. M2MS4P-6 TaxID=2983762 RepID=UPI0021E3B4BC|nr:DUF302 domain-containing protein [Actinotalea sp. M2MS4P-6]MCV2395233.1 DUF302 domain-containing protein [Actinotalea sp. M2MS4P-6]